MVGRLKSELAQAHETIAALQAGDGAWRARFWGRSRERARREVAILSKCPLSCELLGWVVVILNAGFSFKYLPLKTQS